jgi:hypothetical protein
MGKYMNELLGKSVADIRLIIWRSVTQDRGCAKKGEVTDSTVFRSQPSICPSNQHESFKTAQKKINGICMSLNKKNDKRLPRMLEVATDKRKARTPVFRVYQSGFVDMWQHSLEGAPARRKTCTYTGQQKCPKNGSVHPCPERDRTSDLVFGANRCTGDTARSFWPSHYYHLFWISSTMLSETSVGPCVSVVALSQHEFHRSLSVLLTL